MDALSCDDPRSAIGKQIRFGWTLQGQAGVDIVDYH
jgi:hypothetical protein